MDALGFETSHRHLPCTCLPCHILTVRGEAPVVGQEGLMNGDEDVIPAGNVRGVDESELDGKSLCALGLEIVQQLSSVFGRSNEGRMCRAIRRRIVAELVRLHRDLCAQGKGQYVV